MGFSSFSERVEEMIFHNRVILPTDSVPNRTAIANHVVSSLLRGRAVKARCCRVRLTLQILFSHCG